MESTWKRNVADFANIFKAFIGAAYLSMPFAFSEAGLGLGLALLILIGLITDYTSNLIVRNKQKIIEEKLAALTDSIESDQLSTEEKRIVESGELKQHWERYMQLSDIGDYAYGRSGRILVTLCLFVTQFGFCVCYFIFIGNTLMELFPLRNETIASGTQMSTPLVITTSATPVNITRTTIASVTIEPSGPPQYKLVSTAPSLYILVFAPFPVFVVFSYLRSVRVMGPVSVLANLAIVVGCVVVLAYILTGFSVRDDFTWAKFITLPVFFGIVSLAFEGIGTVIPIEASMVGNRHLYSSFLHGALALIVLIMGSFGVLGYLRYGASTRQIVVQNIPQHTITSQLVDCTLIVGVVFTYPLQVFPVVEIAETLLMSTKTGLSSTVVPVEVEEPVIDGEDERPLLEGASIEVPDAEKSDAVDKEASGLFHTVSIKAPTWQRNVLRTMLVVTQLGVALLMKDYFAYFNSFIGAVGCSFLAYILPCAVNLKLLWLDLTRCQVITNIAIMVFGVAGSVMGIIVTTYQIAHRTQHS